MKGLANEIYAIGLILLFVMAYYLIIPMMNYSSNEVIDVRIKNEIFMMEDSLEAAKAYLLQSARYSMYQAVYDNAAKGGSRSYDDGTFLELDGDKYCLWYNNGDISPSDQEITEDLENTTYTNLKKYTDRKMITVIFPVITPAYEELLITRINDFTLHVNAVADEKLSVKRAMENADEVSVKKDSSIDTDISIPYYAMVHQAKEANDYNSERISSCSDDLNYVKDSSFSVVESSIEDKDGKCLVKVTVTSKKKFLVWNGKEVGLQPVTITFLQRYVNQ